MDWRAIVPICIAVILVSCVPSNDASNSPAFTATNGLVTEEAGIYATLISKIYSAQPIYLVEQRAGCPITEPQTEGYQGYKKIRFPSN